MEHKKAVLDILEKTFDDNRPMIVISGGKTGVNFLQGDPVDLIRLVYQAMKRDPQFDAVFRLAQEFDKFKNPEKKEPKKEEEHDCETCEARDICPIAGMDLEGDTDEIFKEMLIKSNRKEYKA